jgi:hypothetical protein
MSISERGPVPNEVFNVDVLKKTLDQIRRDETIQDLIVLFANKLKSRYHNYTDYLAWHILVSSTPLEETKFIDFPGDDSVRSFIESLV